METIEIVEEIQRTEIENKEKTNIKVNPNKKLRINPYGVSEKYLTFLLNKDGERTFTARLRGDIHPVRCWYNNEDKMSILPLNGPTLTEGEKVPHNEDYIIRKINYSDLLETYILDLEYGVSSL